MEPVRNEHGSPGGVDVPRQGPGFGEDDVALVDVNTAATASLMSPNVWIRRPRKAVPMRSPDGTSRGGMYDDENVQPSKTSSRVKSRTTPVRRGQHDEVGELTRHAGMIEREHAGVDHDNNHVSGSSKRTPQGVQTQMRVGESGTRRRRRRSAVFQSDEYVVDETASPEADPGLYVSIQKIQMLQVVRRMVSPGGVQDDDILKTVEENDKAEADLKEISDIEGEIAKNAEVNMLLEQLLASKTKKLEELHVQNATIKRIFGAIDVVKDDFVIEGLSEEERRSKMISIGQRLIQSLRGRHLARGASIRVWQRSESSCWRPRTFIQERMLADGCPRHVPYGVSDCSGISDCSKGRPCSALLSLLEKALEANMMDRQHPS
eukprot:jgi/Picre1/34790/NNA_002256.t1